MIISYEMRSVSRHGKPTPWTEMCGAFDSWEAFERFKARELDNGREARNAREETP